jgi:hypothetical protein
MKMANIVFDRASKQIAEMAVSLQAELEQHRGLQRAIEIDSSNLTGIRVQISDAQAELKKARDALAKAQAEAKQIAADSQAASARILGDARKQAAEIVTEAKARIAAANKQLEAA